MPLPSAKLGADEALPTAPMTAKDAQQLFAALSASNPAPRTELAYENPFTLLIAVLLSAQATDVGVNKATQRLFREAATAEAMLALGEARVQDLIRTIGLYRSKAKNVIELSRLLVERYGGEVPPDRNALEALPGVGRKTASVVLNEAFGLPTIAVDTHVFRVANRTGLAPGKTVKDVEAKLELAVPPAYRKGAHHWLILHGRYVCKARLPECWRCAIRSVCRYEAKFLAMPVPRRASRQV